MGVDVRRTEVDGVPVLWEPGSGRLRAGLVFRVGRADETLAEGGVSHLVEHLVLDGVDRADLHFNGSTSRTTTTFLVDGDAAEVVAFFAAVCRGLRELPVDRLDREKDVLRAEAGSRSTGAPERLAVRRYGPFGYGLPGYAEFGLDGLTADGLRAWIAGRYGRGNAVLWVRGGPPPEGLRLDLPDGPRLGYPEATSALPRLPAYFTARSNGVAFDAVVPRTPAAAVYAAVLDRRLHHRLRRELGVSYAAGAAYAPRDAAAAMVTAQADALAEHRAAVCRGFVDVLVDLARVEVPADELAVAHSLADRAVDLPALAEAVLAGVDLPQPSSAAAAEVREVAARALDTGLALLPEGQAIGRAGFTAAPVGSPEAVAGVGHWPVNAPTAQRRLVVGADGVSLTDGLAVATVRYAECAAMLVWPDGARVLFGPDAVTVAIEPTLWHVSATTLAGIDAAVPDDRVVRQPARDPATVPKPPAERPARDHPGADARPAGTGQRRSPGRRRTIAALQLAGLLAVLAVLYVVNRPAFGLGSLLLVLHIGRVAWERRR